MKKFIAAFLTSIFCFSIFSCAESTYKLPWDQFCSKGLERIELQFEDKKYILNLLNQSKWENDVSKCDCDFDFYTQRQKVGYHSECGIFNDYTRKKHTKVTEEQRLKINKVLQNSTL